MVHHEQNPLLLDVAVRPVRRVRRCGALRAVDSYSRMGAR